jgi:hypothetical protein
LPDLEKLIVCCGNRGSAVAESHGFHRLVELILLSSTISKFAIFSGVPAERSDGEGGAPPKIKVALLKLLRKHSYHSLTDYVDGDGVGTKNLNELLGDYAISGPIQPFLAARIFSFRLDEPEVEKTICYFCCARRSSFAGQNWSAFCWKQPTKKKLIGMVR